MTAVSTVNRTHRGVDLEAAAVGGEVYLTIDGTEVAKRFASTEHAIDYGKRRLDARARREQRAAATNVEACPYPGHAPWVRQWEAEHGFPLDADYDHCPYHHGRNPL